MSELLMFTGRVENKPQNVLSYMIREKKLTGRNGSKYESIKQTSEN